MNEELNLPIPADVLADAEEFVRMYAVMNATEAAMQAEMVMAEYDRRGEALGLLRELVAEYFGNGDLDEIERLMKRADILVERANKEQA